MKYFGIYRKKVNFLFIFSVQGKNLTFFHSHFSLILLGSARLGGIILGVNAVFTNKMAYNVILINR